LDASLSTRYPKWFNAKPGKETKLKSIADEIKSMDKYWNDLIYMVCGKDPGRMRELVKFDVFEFFAYVENSMKNGRD